MGMLWVLPDAADDAAGAAAAAADDDDVTTIDAASIVIDVDTDDVFLNLLSHCEDVIEDREVAVTDMTPYLLKVIEVLAERKRAGWYVEIDMEERPHKVPRRRDPVKDPQRGFVSRKNFPR